MLHQPGRPGRAGYRPQRPGAAGPPGRHFPRTAQPGRSAQRQAGGAPHDRRPAVLSRPLRRQCPPDLFVACADGYRVSWNSVTGGFGAEVIETNEKAWSGDHCIDPELVPGVIFSNQPLGARAPRMVDVAATVLEALGVPVPAHMQGQSLLPGVPPSLRRPRSDRGKSRCTTIRTAAIAVNGCRPVRRR